MSITAVQQIAITKKELLSKEALSAFNVAGYRLRHNERYFGWSEERRLAYQLSSAFDAATEARGVAKCL